MTQTDTSSLRVALFGATIGTAFVISGTLFILTRGNGFMFRDSFLILGWITILIVWLIIVFRFAKASREPCRRTPHAR